MADQNDEEKPSPLDFELYLTYASHQLFPSENITFEFHKSIRVAASTTATARKTKKSELVSDTDTAQTKKKPSETSVETNPGATHIVIATEYDAQSNLVSLKFERDVCVPRMIFKLVETIIVYHPNITNLSFKGGMADYTIHEIRSLQVYLPQLTEVCLDHSVAPHGDYDLLLEDPMAIRSLSLANCNITDEVAWNIFSKLGSGQASRTLSHLSVQMNRITDVGAVYLAEVLRINRKLQYLNLSANKMTDDGVISILNVLKMYPLRHEEVGMKKKAHFEYLFQMATKKPKVAREESSRVTHKTPRKTAVVKTEEDEEEFTHFFHNDNIRVVDRKTYCLGNNVLCSLNLAYNNLSMMTLKALLAVMHHQADDTRKPKGLLRLNIEGNPFPQYCEELNELYDLLDKQIKNACLDLKTATNSAASKKRSQGPN